MLATDRQNGDEEYHDFRQIASARSDQPQLPLDAAKKLKSMSNQEDVRCLLDRSEIQDKVVLYGLGQDLHQPDSENKNILEQWSQLFTPDVEIDLTSLGLKAFGLVEYAKLMRGKDLKGGGLEVSFKAWQHLEDHATIKIGGDTATSVVLQLHTHETRDGKASLHDVGYWHDQWLRTADGWRIKHRRHQSLHINTFPVFEGPNFLKV